MRRFEVQTKLKGHTAEISKTVLTMQGVNYELLPFVKMTAPAQWYEKPVIDWPTGTELFKSMILLFGVLPVDWHKFKLDSVHSAGFSESSTSLMNRAWRHQRSIIQQGDRCLVRDIVEFESRITALTGLMAPVYQAIFRHRHKRLELKYGSGE